ncbi:Metallo-dependent phosphatase-like protein [Lipomyces japonicus]|uniref:Metallo-dependent phosphatase-like protein n=1 Tax=Lipomyces japonicus TaxID=56871 RepID=UPI0034CD5DC3
MPTYEASYPPSIYHAHKPKRRHAFGAGKFYNIAGSGTALLRKLFTVVNLFRIIWIFVLIRGERWVFQTAIESCDWKNWEDWPEDATPSRVVLVADPQLVDGHTYPGRPYPLLALTEFYVDTYMHRAWTYLETKLQSDATIFLGDLFDGGREWDHYTWLKEYQRFQAIFPPSQGKITLYEVAGNHDIGLGNTIVVEALRRFRAYFGEPSRSVEIGNHTIVLLDTDSLMNYHDEEVFAPPRIFLEDLVAKTNQAGDHALPRIVLSHIPFFRLPDKYCGPLRESKQAITLVKGYQYQNVLHQNLSEEVLDRLRPIAIFSGDDHDACQVRHDYDNGNKHAIEYTVKSFSIAMGVNYPAFEMISLWNPNPDHKAFQGSQPTFKAHLCVLPSQFDIFRSYAKLFFLTIIGSIAASYRIWNNKKRAAAKSGIGLGIGSGSGSGNVKSRRDRVFLPYPPSVNIVLGTLRSIQRNKYYMLIVGRPDTWQKEFTTMLVHVGYVAVPWYFYLLVRL